MTEGYREMAFNLKERISGETITLRVKSSKELRLGKLERTFTGHEKLDITTLKTKKNLGTDLDFHIFIFKNMEYQTWESSCS